MRKHTTIDLDMDLLERASQALGTTRVTDTVHAALDDVVRRRLRMSLVEFDPAMDLEDLAAMRAHRFAERPAPYGANPDEAPAPE